MKKNGGQPKKNTSDNLRYFIDQPVEKRLRLLARIFTIFIIIIALLALTGWQFGIGLLKRPVPRLVAMNPLTAVLFTFSGVSFLLLSSKNKTKLKLYTGYTLASLVILLSLIKIVELFFSLHSGVDHILFYKQIQSDLPGTLSNSMAANTAIAFAFTGIALLLLNYETPGKRMPSHFFALIIFLFGFFSLLGYLYGAPEFYDLLKHLPMAVHTAICFLFVSLSILFIYPSKGVAKEFFLPLSGGFIGRILLPGALLIPLILGIIRLYAVNPAVITIELGTTLFVFFIAIIFCITITYNVILLNKKDLLRRNAEEKLRQSEEIFRSLVTAVRDYAIYMLDVGGNIITWNKGAESIKGYTEEEVKGKNISIFYTKEDIEKNEPGRILTLAKENGRFEQEGWRVRKDGSVFWADAIVTALHNDEGELTGYAKVTRDMTERKKAKDLLSDFNKELARQVEEKTKKIEDTTLQLRQLAAYLQIAREEERKTIAREIHDEFGQMLTGLKMDIVWLAKNITEQDGSVTERFEGTMELLNQTRKTIRRISTDLHPAILDDLGLVAALELYSREFETRSGIKTNFISQLDNISDADIEQNTKIGLYRVFQESLTNVAKHSGAKKVDAFLKTRNGNLVLNISDDGKGFDMNEPGDKKTLGLISIRERAFMMNGAYEIHSIPGEGTTILLTVPLTTK